MINSDEIIVRIDEVAEIMKRQIKKASPALYWIERYIELIEYQQKIKRHRKILIVKRLTMGLTYFEAQRLKYL